MDLEPNEEQRQIRESTASFVAKRLPIERLHGRLSPPDEVDPATWREVASMGWLGMSLPETSGGVGYGLVEEMLVFRELGRCLAPPRILICAVAAKLAFAAGDTTLARQIAAGERAIAFAAPVDFSPGPAARLRVFEAKGADLALRMDGGRARLVDLTNWRLDPRPSLDKSVSLAVGEQTSAEAVVCAGPADSVRTHAVILLAATLLGQAEQACSMITEYAKLRQTFGRPIGAYQAVRHPIAEMAVRCEKAKSQLFVAALIAARGGADAATQASMARVLCHAAALKNADDNIQLHGGIGVTDEFIAHFLLKRAHMTAEWFGSPRADLEQVLHAPVLPY